MERNNKSERSSHTHRRRRKHARRWSNGIGTPPRTPEREQVVNLNERVE
jgi:hypothetical protein